VVWLVAVGLNTHVGGQGRVLLSGVAESVADTVADPAGKGAECSHGGDLMEDFSSLKGPWQIATGRSTCSPQASWGIRRDQRPRAGGSFSARSSAVTSGRWGA
jgi:hypothetical protein